MIIGTIHSGNKYFNHKTLFNYLEKNNPDVILQEQATSFKRVFGLRTAKFLRFWKPSIEQLALQKYSTRYRNVEILGFDTAFDSKGNYKKKIIKFERDFFDSFNNVKKSFADSLVYAEYANKRNEYYNFLFNVNLIRLNKPDVINMTRALYEQEEKYILPLAKKYIQDSSLVNMYEKEMTFWYTRNWYMVKQIKNYSKIFAGKRIIILTGFNHKYFLTDKLLDDQNINIRIINLSEK